MHEDKRSKTSKVDVRYSKIKLHAIINIENEIIKNYY